MIDIIVTLILLVLLQAVLGFDNLLYLSFDSILSAMALAQAPIMEAGQPVLDAVGHPKMH